ncbi:hypothetical protein [Parablautia intestinalis]|jgi:hypothetical protein|nr:hypothetical protein [Parablautia intestinalis]MCI8616401.1 hypothetical protein [Lachnospiraceae bacterium]
MLFHANVFDLYNTPFRKVCWCLMAVGIGFGLLSMMYLLYTAFVKHAFLKIEASGEKAMTAAFVVTLTEGNVVYSGDDYVAVEYFYEWDGAYYRWISAHANAAYIVNTKVPVVYTLGMGIGSCFVVGFYRKYMLLLGIMGLILFFTGFILKSILILNLKRKETEKWQEEKL